MTRIAELAQMMLDHRLGLLRSATTDLDRSKLQLKALNSVAEPTDLPFAAGQTISLTYERWANVRRSDLNLVIARQTASWISAREDAVFAFGRLQALRAVFKTLKK